eukprot:330188-Chlamydomonas_euryale.AAC.1
MELRKGTLRDKALPAVFVGMQPGWAAWRIFMGDGQVKVSRDVRFNESVFSMLPAPVGAPVAEEEYMDEQLRHIERAAQQAALVGMGG